MTTTYEALVFVDTKRNYYARWSRIEKRITHAFVTEEALSPYWVEVIRTNPHLLHEEAA